MKIPSRLLTVALIVILMIGGALAVMLSLPKSAAQQAGPNTPRIPPTATATKLAGITAIATSPAVAQGIPVPGALVRVWNSMCVEGVPYTLLSVPRDAKFALVQPQAQVPGTSVPITGITATPSSIPAYSTPSFVGGTAAPLPTSPVTPEAARGTAIVPATGLNSNKGTLGIVPSQNSCTGLGQMNGLQLIMCTGPEGSLLNAYVRDANGAQFYQGTLWDCATVNPAPTRTLRPAPAGSLTPQPTALPATLPPTLLPSTVPPTVPATSAPPATATP